MNNSLAISDPRNENIIYVAMCGDSDKWTLAALDKRNLETSHIIVKNISEEHIYNYVAAIYDASCKGLTKEATGKTIKKALKATIKSVKNKA